MNPLVNLALLFIILVVVLIILYFVWWLYNNTKQNSDNFDQLSDELKQIGKLLLVEEGLETTNVAPVAASSTTETKKKSRKPLFAALKFLN